MAALRAAAMAADLLPVSAAIGRTCRARPRRRRCGRRPSPASRAGRRCRARAAYRAADSDRSAGVCGRAASAWPAPVAAGARARLAPPWPRHRHRHRHGAGAGAGAGIGAITATGAGGGRVGGAGGAGICAAAGSDDGRSGIRSSGERIGRGGCAARRRGRRLGRRRRPQRARAAVGAHLFEIHQQVGEPALDGIEMAEPRVGGIELFRQLGDAIFERAERELIALAELHAVEPLAQRADRAFQLRRHRAAAFHQRGDPRLQPAQRFGRRRRRRRARTGRRAQRTSAASCARAPSDATLDTTPRSDITACSSCLNASGSLDRQGGAGDLVDLVRQRAHRLFEADQAFGRRETAQRVAHLRKPCSSAASAVAIGAGLPGAVDPLGQRANFRLQRLDRAARHGVGQRPADLGEIVAQRANASS